jgi:hypothetical protein
MIRTIIPGIARAATAPAAAKTWQSTVNFNGGIMGSVEANNGEWGGNVAVNTRNVGPTIGAEFRF